MSRFIDGDWCLHEDEERHHYLRLLGIALGHSDARCIAYALMTSHIHLAMVGGDASLVAWANRINSSFALWMNHRHERLGPVFGGRPKQSSIPPGQAGRLLAYIHNNPVRAGLVARARQSAWTSHRAYLGEVVTPRWLDVDEGLAHAGLDASAFERWVDQHETTGRKVRATRDRRCADVGDDEVTLGDHRGAGGGQYAIGDEHRWRCADGVHRANACDHVDLAELSTPAIAPDLSIVMSVVEAITGVPSVRLRFPDPVPAVIAARKLVVRSAVEMGVSVSDIAAALAITLASTIRIERESVTAAERTLIEIVVQRLSPGA